MRIKIKSDEEFLRLLNALSNELVYANIHWRLHNDLKSKVKIFAREYSQSPAFWQLTFQAHMDAVIFRLIRIYDRHSGALSLPNLLDTIKDNLHIFDEERFRERLKDNPFVESLAADSRKPDERQLNKDIQFSGDGNLLVEKLTGLRNKLFAHKDARNVIMDYRFTNQYPVTNRDINKLLKGGMRILNRYTLLFHSTTHSTQMVGHDDYKYVLKSVRVNLRETDKKIKDQLKALEAKKR